MARTLIRAIDRLNNGIGISVAWFALAMVLVQFLVVVLRYVFGVGWLFLQESIVYLHGAMFMLGSAYTLLHNGHVRVDIFYRDADPRWKAKVDVAGHVLFLIPVCALILIYSWPYVVSSWASLEGSREISGIPAVFLLKTVVLVFCVLMILQGLAQGLKALLVLTGRARAADVYPSEPDPTEDARASAQ
ncbi:C4-dicarboxylate ABC transporter permease [Rhodovibrio sodomensis]|uniref:TRAP transporter small permease protein n=1 Tax=Rhodovibrio sodomensis TaxID=1088 RepID=A0ABS1DG10_9PROT|nr:TRAP transporter small permease subunit [Rhodovibrio sodomensis]MBK1668901.1 C4-dicarboxylate ABC transporter permease [Rhodovibrio sodomensis]